MLTWSDWHTEMRSNRYHYATRFSSLMPVIFVQTDGDGRTFNLEKLEGFDIWILHVGSGYGKVEYAHIRKAIRSFGSRQPLIWTYNGFFSRIVQRLSSELKVYHATEDYFCDDFNTDPSVSSAVRKAIAVSNVLIAVSEGVLESYVSRGGYTGYKKVISNGVDFKFWSQAEVSSALTSQRPRAIYQGGISRKIDFGLMAKLIDFKKDWDFHFFGRIFESQIEFETLQNRENVFYRGSVDVNQLRSEFQFAHVGLIPFVQNDWITKRSFPLKTFEYLAAAVPVVSVPIESLQAFGDSILFARTAEEFANQLDVGFKRRIDENKRRHLMARAMPHDYDFKFESLLHFLENVWSEKPKGLKSFFKRIPDYFRNSFF